jgi:predicted ArsR family transcriptional regulator
MDDEALRSVTGLGALADPVRLALYQYVVEHPGTGRNEAAVAAKVGRPLAAYHLDCLVDAGLLAVRFEERAQRGGRNGRPAKLYERSTRAFAVQLPPRDDALVARVLARTIEELQVDNPLSTVTRVARALGADIGAAAKSTTAIDVLRSQGFEPVAEAGGAVQLRNCPFHALVDEHRELVCHMNAALVAGILIGLDNRQLRAELDPEPGRCCVTLRPAKQGT